MIRNKNDDNKSNDIRISLQLADPEESTQTQNDEESIDFLVYWHIFKKYLGITVFLTLFIGLLAILVAYSLQPIYRSTAFFLLEMGKSNVVPINDINQAGRSGRYGIHPYQYDYHIKTQIEILQYRALSEKLVKKLKLVSHPVFLPKKDSSRFNINWRQWFSALLPPSPQKRLLSDKEKQQRVVNAVMYNLKIDQIRDTLILGIRYESPSAKLSSQIVNTLLELYIEQEFLAKQAMSSKASEWLTSRINSLRKNLLKSEKKLQAYMEKENLVSVTDVKSVATIHIEQTVANLVEARLHLAQTKSVYAQVRKLKNKSSQAFESVPAVLNHPLIQDLKKIELAASRKISEMKESYGRKHPNMISAQVELKTARSNTSKQIKLVIGGILNEYEIATANVKALRQYLQENKAMVQKINKKHYRLKVLEREVAMNRKLYDLFLTRFKETDALQDIQTLQSTAGRIVEPALVSTIPYKPRKTRIVLISMLLGFIFLNILAFMYEYIDNTLSNSDDVEQKLGVSILGALPKIPVPRKDELKPRLMFLKEQNSQFAESIRNIRTGIMLSDVDITQKVLLVTSSMPGEGKSTVSVNEAFALGQMGKTLLIEADIRRPTMTKTFGLNRKAPGLSELISGTGTFEECIHQIGDENSIEGSIHLIPSGTTVPHPLELLGSERFKALMEKLMQQDYMYIILDTPPIMAVSDALVLSKYANRILYVVRANATHYQVVRDGLKRLRQINAPQQDLILNHLDIKKSSRYYYSKYRYYNYKNNYQAY